MVEGRRRYCPCTTDGFLLLVAPIFFLFLFRDVSVAAAADASSSPPLDEKQASIMANLTNIVGNGWATTASNPCDWRGVGCSPSGSGSDSGSSSVVTNLTLRGRRISNSAVFTSICRLDTLQRKQAVSEGTELDKWALSLSAKPDQREKILDPRVSRTSAAVHNQVLSLLNIALSCVALSPDARPKMRNVLRSLFNAK